MGKIMKNITKALFGLGLIIVVVGIFGMILGTNINPKVAVNSNYYSAPQTTMWNDDSYSGMMGRRSNIYNNENYSNVEKLDVEILEDSVEDYLDKFDEILEISDIFIFNDTDYYYSIIEKDTGMGAMELLVNPYTGDVYQEYGPNMMWNLKYGMMGNQKTDFYGGMMGNQKTDFYGGMMGNQNTNGYGGMTNNQNQSEQWCDFYDDDNYRSDGKIEVNKLSSDEAFEYGEKFLDGLADGYSLSDSYHELYGYFTFHVKDKDEAFGMLSVNAFTGEVWFHDWHGDLIEIIGSHEE
jgi:hypothetical protein